MINLHESIGPIELATTGSAVERATACSTWPGSI